MHSGAAVGQIHVHLPSHLRRLVGIPSTDLTVSVQFGRGGTITVGDVLAVLEHTHPALRGTLHDHGPDVRRVKPHIRVFAGGEDLTTLGLSATLPADVIEGRQPLRIIGAIAGGA
jgi:hypothetical protein